MKYAPLKTSLSIAKGGTFFFLKDKNTILAVHLFSVGWYCRMFCSVSAGCCKVFEKQLHGHPDVSVSMSNRAESFNSPCLEVRPFTLSLLSVPVNTVLKTDRAAFAHRRCVNHGWTSVSKAFSDGLSVFSGYDSLCAVDLFVVHWVFFLKSLAIFAGLCSELKLCFIICAWVHPN